MLVAFLKINILLALFSLVYYVALRKLTFYQLNRWYFLLAIGCSFACPFIDLSALFSPQQQTAISGFVPAVSYNLPGTAAIPYLTLIGVLFFTGGFAMLLRLATQFVSLYKVHKYSASGQLHNTAVQLLQEKLSPFSFGRYIYINPQLHTAQEQKTILAHEKIHVQQWHTLDIMLTEIVLLLSWFNPAAWFMSKAIRENLEFVTDHAVLQKGFDRKLYQYSLLQVSASSSSVTIANEFTLKDIKKRIQMMNGKRSSRFRLISYSAFPLLLTVFLLFSVSAKETSQLLESLSTTVEEIVSPVKADEANNRTGIADNKSVVHKKARRKKARPVSTIAAAETNTHSSAPGGETSTGNLLPDEDKDVRVVQGHRIPPTEITGIVKGIPLAPQNTADTKEIIVTGYAKPKQ